MAYFNLQSIRLRCSRNWSITSFSIGIIISLFSLSAAFVFAQEGTAAQSTPASSQVTTKTPEDELAELRKKVEGMDAEVSRLKMLVAKLDQYRQIDYIRDLLLKEEQRGEVLQALLVEISAKETPVQTRIDEIDDILRPQRLEQQMAGVGSTRPEEDRDSIRNRLANEKRRNQTQLELLRQSRLRLQASLTTADASIARLRQRLTEAARPQ